MQDGTKLYLWKNGDHYLAFTHLYPCFTPGGDPMVLGEPAGVAVFRESHDRASETAETTSVAGLTNAESKLRMIFNAWNEFGPEHGFGELMDRLQGTRTFTDPPAVEYTPNPPLQWEGEVPAEPSADKVINLRQPKPGSREAFEVAVVKAALDLCGHTLCHEFRLPVSHTDPQLFVTLTEGNPSATFRVEELLAALQSARAGFVDMQEAVERGMDGDAIAEAESSIRLLDVELSAGAGLYVTPPARDAGLNPSDEEIDRFTEDIDGLDAMTGQEIRTLVRAILAAAQEKRTGEAT